MQHDDFGGNYVNGDDDDMIEEEEREEEDAQLQQQEQDDEHLSVEAEQAESARWNLQQEEEEWILVLYLWNEKRKNVYELTLNLQMLLDWMKKRNDVFLLRK